MQAAQGGAVSRRLGNKVAASRVAVLPNTVVECAAVFRYTPIGPLPFPPMYAHDLTRRLEHPRRRQPLRGRPSHRVAVGRCGRVARLPDRRWAQPRLLAFMRGRGMDIPAALAPNRNRVAIVDDDRLHVQMLSRMLTGTYPGISVETAADGFAAGAMLFSFKPNLIFLDLVMPGMDGFEVCRRIRADSAFDDVGIVIVTGHLTEAWRQRLEELGADECLVKPFRPRDLEPLLERFVPEGLAAEAS